MQWLPIGKRRKKWNYNQGIEFVASIFQVFKSAFAYTGDHGEVELDVEVQDFVLGYYGNHIVTAVKVSHHRVGLVPFVSEEERLLLSLGFKGHSRELVVRLAGNLRTN